jgi:hypothetical protein
MLGSARAEPRTYFSQILDKPGDIRQTALAQPERQPLGSDDESARALERFLVTTGGLVLPKYSFEIQPQISYLHDGASSQGTKRDTVTSSLTLRLGLPFDSQAEVQVAYVVHDATAAATTSGLGDVRVGLTKQLLRESQRAPSLLATAHWQAPTGTNEFRPDQLATGTGFNIVDGQLTVVKRQDPLVFFGAVTYSHAFPERHRGVWIEPADVFGGKAGGILAASPDTSLNLALTLAFADEAKVGRRSVRGSDQVVGTIELGVAQILSKRLLLTVTTEIGITEDAPDFRLSIALPVRF